MAQAPTTRLGTLAGGDALRALAAVMVVIFHVYVGWGPLGLARDPGLAFDGPGSDLVLRFSAGLYLFFALSGYLVGGPWVRALLGDGPAPRLGRYVNHRVLRIVPALVVVWLVLVVTYGGDGAPTHRVLLVPVFAQVFVHEPAMPTLLQGWTLDVEAMFYLALPLLFAVSTKGSGSGVDRRVVVGALVVTAGASLVARSWPGVDLVAPGARTVLTLWWAFTPGLLLAAIEVPARARLAGTRLGARLAVAALTAAVGALAGLAVGHGLDGQALALVAYAVFGGGLLAAALLWQWTRGAGLRGLDAAPLRALGRISYGIYLVHVGVATLLVRHAPGGLGAHTLLAYLLVTTLAGSVAAAALLWRLVERPALARRVA